MKKREERKAASPEQQQQEPSQERDKNPVREAPVLQIQEEHPN